MRNVFWRQIRLLLVVFIGYLFHVTVMTQLDTTVSINLPLVILSVVMSAIRAIRRSGSVRCTAFCWKRWCRV